MIPDILFLLLIPNVAFGICGAIVARRKGYDPAAYLIGGIFLSFFPLIVILGSPVRDPGSRRTIHKVMMSGAK